MDTQGKAIYERIEHIYKTSKDVLLRTAYMFVRDEEAARDIVAEAFMTLIENRQEVNPEKFYPYLYSIVQHKAIDHRRADIRHSRIAQKIRTKEERMMEYYTLAIESGLTFLGRLFGHRFNLLFKESELHKLCANREKYSSAYK